MLDTLGAEEPFGDPFDLTPLSPDDEDLQAVMLVEMDVHGRDDLFVIPVLECGKGFGQLADIMAVHERDGADGFAVGERPFLLDQPLTDEIPDRLGPGRVAHLLDELVKSSQQVIVHRYAEPYRVRYFFPHYVFIFENVFPAG